ncbi:MAG: DUF6886 family protein [Ilumatobacteraceae bacterium]
MKDTAIGPADVQPVGDLLDLHATADIELRAVPSLWPIRDLAVSHRTYRAEAKYEAELSQGSRPGLRARVHELPLLRDGEHVYVLAACIPASLNRQIPQCSLDHEATASPGRLDYSSRYVVRVVDPGVRRRRLGPLGMAQASCW